MQLLPCFGCFSPIKKECVITLDGLYESSLEERYRPSLIINLNQENLLPQSISWITIENKVIREENELAEILKELEKDYNIIVHTNEIDKIDKLILNDLYGFNMHSVGIGTLLKGKTIEEWYDFVLELRATKNTIKNNDYFKVFEVK